MKKLFRVRASILTLMAATVLMACGNTEGNNADTSSDGSAASSTDSINSDLPYIGIMQLTTHPALDQIGEGIIDQLEEAGHVKMAKQQRSISRMRKAISQWPVDSGAVRFE